MSDGIRDYQGISEKSYNYLIYSFSFGNLGKDETGTVSDRSTKTLISLGFNIGMNLVLLVFAHYYKISIIKYNNQLDANPSDFTVMVRNLPKNKDEDEVMKHFMHVFPYADVQKVNFTYKIDRIVKLGFKKLKLQK